MTTTLLCWCRDDSNVSQAAKKYPAERRYSGCRRAALPQTLGALKADDVLMITAHGDEDSFGEAGIKFSDFTVTEFAEQLIECAPRGWRGSLYFDTCKGHEFARNLRP